MTIFNHAESKINGVGLGLKRELIPQIQAAFGQELIANINFFEIAPENWIDVGGKARKQLDWFVERYPIVCHGLCLSLGGLAPLNTVFLQQVKKFLQQYDIPLYTEHLSYSTDAYKGQQGYLYDLLPIPFTEEAVHYVAKRIRQTQDILGQRIAIENASFYVQAPVSTMSELTFIQAVLTEADCLLHLDINNIYLNSVNFGFDAHEFLLGIPGERIVYSHVAGHYQQTPDLLIETHGEDVIDPDMPPPAKTKQGQSHLHHAYLSIYQVFVDNVPQHGYIQCARQEYHAKTRVHRNQNSRY